MKDNNLSTEDYKKIAKLDELLKKDPNNINLLMQKAYIYADGYDDKNAISIYEQIIKLEPKYTEAYFWLSYYFYQIIGNTFKAIYVAKEGLKINPYRVDLHLVIAWSNSYEDGNKDELLFHLKKALELEPAWIAIRITLIEFLIKNKKFDEAKQQINETLKWIPDDFQLSILNKMQIYYKTTITQKYDPTAKETMQKFLKKIEAATENR